MPHANPRSGNLRKVNIIMRCGSASYDLEVSKSRKRGYSKRRGENFENKRNELQNKIESGWQQLLLLQEQLILLSNNVENYKRLLDGENEKFNYGESSVFLLNKRQEKYINGQLKLIETYIKRQMELLNFLYFSNQLVN